MKVLVSRIGPYPLADTLLELARAHGRRHQLTESPEEADLILLCGSFAYNPHYVLDHPLYRKFPKKTVVYTGDDAYCPVLPGVYASPRRGLSTLTGRVRSYSYASSYGLHANAVVDEASRLPVMALPRTGSVLFSFVGSPNSSIRRRLFKLYASCEDAVVRDSSTIYQHFDTIASRSQSGQRQYLETVRSSNFVLCPRGRGTGSIRLFEVMSLGRAPVLLTDAYVLPRGPQWDRFLLRVPERRIRRLPAILRRFEATSGERGAIARAEWDRWFAREVVFDHIVDAASEAHRVDGALGWIYRPLAPVLISQFRFRVWSRTAIARAMLRASRLAHGRVGGGGA